MVQTKDPTSTIFCLQQQLLVYAQRRGEAGQAYWIFSPNTFLAMDYFHLGGFLMCTTVNLVSDSQWICFGSAFPACPSELMHNFLHLQHSLGRSFTCLSAPGFHSWLVMVRSPPIHLDIKLILRSMQHFTLIYIEFYPPFYCLRESLHKNCLQQKVPVKWTNTQQQQNSLYTLR